MEMIKLQDGSFVSVESIESIIINEWKPKKWNVYLTTKSGMTHDLENFTEEKTAQEFAEKISKELMGKTQ